jgi:hypothetical protein
MKIAHKPFERGRAGKAGMACRAVQQFKKNYSVAQTINTRLNSLIILFRIVRIIVKAFTVFIRSIKTNDLLTSFRFDKINKL